MRGRHRTRSRPATSASSLATARWRAVWLNPQSGTRASRSGGTPVGEDRLDPGGDLGGGLDMRTLDVDDAGRDVPPGIGDLAQDPDLAHLAVRELEDELVDGEASMAARIGRYERGASGRPRKFPKQRWAPSRTFPTAGSIAALKRATKSAGASGWIAGDGSSTWRIVAPAATRPRISAATIGTNASAAATRVGVDLDPARSRAARTACTARAA